MIHVRPEVPGRKRTYRSIDNVSTRFLRYLRRLEVGNRRNKPSDATIGGGVRLHEKIDSLVRTTTQNTRGTLIFG